MGELEQLEEEIRRYAGKISASHDGNPMLEDYVKKIIAATDRIRQLKEKRPES